MKLERNTSVEGLVLRNIVRGTDFGISVIRYRVDDKGNIGLRIELKDGSKFNTSAVTNICAGNNETIFQTKSGSLYAVSYNTDDSIEVEVINSLIAMYEVAKKLRKLSCL